VAALLLAWAWYAGRPVPGWSILGWALATSLGAFCGARLILVHGTPGTAFLKVQGSCILARLFTFAGGTAWAFSHSIEEALAFLFGVVAGYLPTQILEMVWFASRTRNQTR
jgi:hypothetical protein